MKPPTDSKIREDTYSHTYQETGNDIEWFIAGQIYMRDIWLESLASPSEDKWIYERDEDKIYRRRIGAPHKTRELLNG